MIVELTRLILTGLVFAAACSPVGPPAPAAQLEILSKGAPTVIVEVDGVERMRVSCNGTGVVTPGGRMPSPPFNLRIVRQDDGRPLLNQRITELPRWVLVTRDSADVSDAPIDGPFVACR